MKDKVFIDVETSGLSYKWNQILTIGLILDRNGAIRCKKEIKIKYNGYSEIDKEALKINRIDLSEHNRLGVSEEEAINLVYNLLYKHNFFKPTVIGHNVSFDISFLKRVFRYYNRIYPFSNLYQDTMILANTFNDIDLINVDNVRLSTVCNAEGIFFKSHDSYQDILATRDLYYIYLSKLTNSGVLHPII